MIPRVWSIVKEIKLKMLIMSLNLKLEIKHYIKIIIRNNETKLQDLKIAPYSASSSFFFFLPFFKKIYSDTVSSRVTS